MLNRVKSALFVVGIIMIFTAQTNRPDDKGRHAAVPGHAPVAHNTQSRPQVQNHPQVPNRNTAPRNTPGRPQVPNHKVVPQRTVHQAPSPVQNRGGFQQSRQQTEVVPRVYGIPVPKDARNDNNRPFHHQHHKQWQPLYNFYDNQYHFYPYVNVTTRVELSADFVTIVFNGQTYFYDQGSFYVQDPQGYLATPPPIGLIVSVLPQNARQITTDSQVYYRYKGVCYAQVPQGYQVVEQVQSISNDS
jgi:hypothetical protein